MNFFGHAEVASWLRPPPLLVLGAMLPDFWSMIRAARPTVSHRDLTAGILLHHATDGAFHDLPEFVDLVASGRAELAAGGLPKGAARAAAHIGIELLLDEVLHRDPAGREAYFSALTCATSRPLPITWQQDDGRRFSDLISTLAERGLPKDPPPPAQVARRLRRALASRPRLAFGEEQEDAVGGWVVRARRAVVGCAPIIVAELRLRLRAAGFDAMTESDSPFG